MTSFSTQTFIKQVSDAYFNPKAKCNRGVKNIAKLLPAGLQADNENCNLFSRLVCLHSNKAVPALSTQEEIKIIKEIVSGGISISGAVRKYFLVKRTLESRITAVLAILGVKSTAALRTAQGVTQEVIDEAVERSVKSVHKAGRKFTVASCDVDILVGIADEAKKSGQGYSTARLQQRLGELITVQSQAKDGEDAVISSSQLPSKQFVRENMKRAAESLSTVVKMRKTSKYSAKRAQASNPFYALEMQTKILAMYKKHFEEGILLTRQPNVDQINNGDEIGFDPNGHMPRVLSLGKLSKRQYMS